MHTSGFHGKFFFIVANAVKTPMGRKNLQSGFAMTKMPDKKKEQNFSYSLIIRIIYIINIIGYSSSSNAMASLEVISNSYSSLLPTIMLSKSRIPVPAGIG